jgi:hypothetical protein
VKQVLSSLLLVTKQGGLRQELTIDSQKQSGGWWRLPVRVTQLYRNTGNVHVVPRGIVSVRDPFGREVRRGAINENSKVILPETKRSYTTQLLSLTGAWWPGRYSVVTAYRYDGTDQTRTYTQHFFHVGQAVVWLVVAASLLAVGWWAWWLWGRPRGWLLRRRRR